MKERDNYMFCCDCGLAVKKSKMVIKKYQNFKVNKDNIYCQRVDAIRGMMFSYN